MMLPTQPKELAQRASGTQLPESIRFDRLPFAIAVTGQGFSGVTYLLAADALAAKGRDFVTPERCDSQFLLQCWYGLLRSRASCLVPGSEHLVVLCREEQLVSGDLAALARAFLPHRFYFAVPLQGRTLNAALDFVAKHNQGCSNVCLGFYDEHSIHCLYRLVQHRPVPNPFNAAWPPSLFKQALAVPGCTEVPAAQAPFLLSCNQILSCNPFNPELPAKDDA